MRKNAIYSLAISLILAISCVLAPGNPVKATETHVNPGDPLQVIINSAAPHDTIILNPGTYVDQWLTINKPLTIRGTDKTNTILLATKVSAKNCMSVVNTTDVHISDLTCDNYTRGIRLDSTFGSSITNNNFLNAKGSIITDYCGIEFSFADNNLIAGNYFAENEFGIILRHSFGNTIENNEVTASKNGNGIWLNSSTNNLLLNNEITHGYSHGIFMNYNSNNNTVSGNDIHHNFSGSGIFTDFCSHNTFATNNIHDNRYNGILIYNTPEGNIVINNDIYDNGSSGVHINTNSANNTIVGNYIHGHSTTLGRGITLHQNVQNTQIHHNTIEGNRYGLYIYNSHYTKTYNNNFLNNWTQVNISSGAEPVFDLGLPTGGNYWSNWNTPDSDPVDGFVDNPYVFYNGVDNWPWANPDGWLNPLPPVNHAPVADLVVVPYPTTENYPVDLDGSSSYDPDPGDSIVEYRWKINGTWTAWSPYMITSHMWCDDYKGTVTLEVKDNAGLTDTATAAVRVTNLPPMVDELYADQIEVYVGDTVKFTGIGKDPGCDVLKAEWSGGDGLYLLKEGLPPAYADNVTHQYLTPGVHPVTLTLTDDDGASDSKTIYVTVLEPAGCGSVLMAGQYIDSGDVSFWNDNQYVYVSYKTKDGWRLTETHLQVATSLNGIPQTKKGSPIPGQFAWKNEHDPGVTEYEYKIPISDLNPGWLTAQDACGETVYIAAHAVVEQVVNGEVIQEETAWADGLAFPGKNWATYFTCTIHCKPVPPPPM